MVYGIAHTFVIINNTITKTAIGYVVGIDNIILYNNNNTTSKVEKITLTLPQDLTEII
jgi:hypothetical protein